MARGDLEVGNGNTKNRNRNIGAAEPGAADGLGCCCCGALGLLIVFVLVVVISSIRTVDVKDAVVARSALEPILLPDIVEAGTYSINKFPIWPLLVVWPNREEQLAFSEDESDNGEIQCNSIDGLQILLDVSLQYKVDTSAIYELTKTYKNFDVYSEFLEDVARATIQHACGMFTAEEFQTKRNEVAEAVSVGLKQDIQERLQASVTQTQLRNIKRPQEYDDKVREKENALNEIALAIAERAQQVTLATTDKRKAELEALRELDSAQRDSDIAQAQAAADAEGIIDNYRALVDVYSAIKDQAGLTEEGILAYIGNEIFSGDTLAATTVALSSPSRVSYQGEL